MPEEKIEKKLTQMQKAMEGGKKNASAIGMSAAIVLTWVVTTFTGVPVPAEVVAAVAGLMTAVATNIQNARDK